MEALQYSGNLDCTPIFSSIIRGKAVNTLRAYKTGFSKWKIFAESNNLIVFPVNKIEFTLFLINWVEDGGSWPSLRNAICSVKFYMDFFSFEFNIPSQSHIEQYLRKNARKVNNKKRPLLKSEIDKIYYTCKDDISVQNYRNLCILLFGFFGFLRFDDLSQIRLKDVTVIGNVISIVLYDAKNDYNKEGQNVRIKCSEGWLVIFKTYLKISGMVNYMCNDDYFLFPAMKDGALCSKKKIGYKEVRSCILNLCSRSGVDAKNIGSHSLRIGGCTEATRRGIPDHILDIHGRWALNSRARSGYQRLIEEDFCWVSEVLMN